MPEILWVNGRVLFLSQDPALIEAQLAGRTCRRPRRARCATTSRPTRSRRPTTCLLYDERLGREALIGLQAPATHADRQGRAKRGFSVRSRRKAVRQGLLARAQPDGRARAGIRLVVAESFERIYRQNADNLGLFTSTDFSLIERIRNGEPIDIEELVSRATRWRAAILRTADCCSTAGRRCRSCTQDRRKPPTERLPARRRSPRRSWQRTWWPRRHGADLQQGQGAFVRADWRFLDRVLHADVRAHAAPDVRPAAALHDPATFAASRTTSPISIAALPTSVRV